MPHLITKVVGFEILADHTLRVRFDDGSAQVIDFLPTLGGELIGNRILSGRDLSAGGV